MLKIAVWGAAGNMGTRAVNRLREHPEYEVLCVEAFAAGVDRLRARGDEPVAPGIACGIADVVLLAIADRYLPATAAEIVPRLRPGCVVITLDPAAAYADALPAREDVAYFVTHPTHPSVFNDEPDPAARRDRFGAGLARQSIVSALVQGPESAYAIGEGIARAFFSPILRSHRVTIEQLALLEPAMAETCSGTFIVAMKEAMDEVVARGVPAEAARDFLLGHINVQLAIVFEEIDWKMSEGAYQVIREAMQRVFRPDWKGVFDTPELKASVRGIVGLG